MMTGRIRAGALRGARRRHGVLERFPGPGRSGRELVGLAQVSPPAREEERAAVADALSRVPTPVDRADGERDHDTARRPASS